MAETSIHASSIIDPKARVGKGTYVGPFCIIGPDVTIGANCRLEGYVSIGTPAEHRDHFHDLGTPGVVIGDNCVLREHVTINRGTKRVTQLGNSVVMLRGSHIGHDALIEDNVNISCNVLVGGHAHVMRGANLGLGCMVHQFVVVGSWSMVGMGSVVTKQTPINPGNIYVGNPARHLKPNSIGIERNGVTEALLDSEVKRWESLKAL